MMRNRFTQSLIQLAVLLVVPVVGRSQTPQQTLVLAGGSDHVPVIQINGKSYVDIESLARITHASVSYQANQITLALPGSAGAAPALSDADKLPRKDFSKSFLRAGIEEMTVIREWRIAIVNAVQTNNPVTEDWISRFRLAAQSKLALASAEATTDADHKAVDLLRNEYSNMQQLSDQFIALRANATYTPPNSFDNNPLDQKILTCARSLAAMAAANQFQDDSACH